MVIKIKSCLIFWAFWVFHTPASTLFAQLALGACVSHQLLLSSVLRQTVLDPELFQWLHFYPYLACSFFSSLVSLCLLPLLHASFWSLRLVGCL